MQTSSGLEVDARQNGLHSTLLASDDAKYTGVKIEPTSPSTNSPSPERPKKILGLQQAALVLSVVLAVVLILEAVSAVIAGVYTARTRD